MQSPERAGERTASRLAKEYWPLGVLLLLMAAAFLLRLYYLDKHTEYTADSYYFLILARSIRDTFTYTVRGVAHAKYLPGFPIFIWLGSYLFGGIGRSANAIALIGATLTVPVTYLLGKELFNKWAGLLAAMVVALQPTFLKWTVLPMTEGLFTFLFSLGAYLVLTGCKRASPARRITGAVAGGLCLLTRWEGVLFLPLAVLIVILYFREARIKWWEVPVLLVAFAGPIGVYVIRNEITTGRFSAYANEFSQNSKLSFALLKHRFKVYMWQGMSDSFFYVFFYIGAITCLALRKWKAFLIVGGWFALFVVLHMFWYYTYERFMAPAAPAVALFIGFLFYEMWVGVRAAFGPGGLMMSRMGPDRGASAGGEHERGPKHTAGAKSHNARVLSAVLQVAGYTVVALLLAGLLAHGLVRANTVIAQDYKAFADDHGGRGMAQAAQWLEQNAPGEAVAVDAGPYFDWLYNGDVLYVRPVPWDLPVEDRDVDGPNIAGNIYDRGIRYLVIGQTEAGVDAELATVAFRPEDKARLREVARWVNHYDYPEPHDLTTVIFEVLPPS